MIFSIVSSLLGILSLSSPCFYPVGFIFLVPFFYFLYTEKRFWKLLAGTFVFRSILLVGTVYYTAEPLNWSTSILLFLGLAFFSWIVNRTFPTSRYARLIGIAILYCLFDIIEAKYSFLPTYLVTVGTVLGASPFVGLAKYGGVMTLELFVLASNTSILMVVLGIWPSIAGGQVRPSAWKRTLSVLVSFTLFFSGAFLLSGYFLRQNASVSSSYGRHLRVTAVSVKDVSPFGMQKFLANVADIPTDLLVLPEELFVKEGNDPYTGEEASMVIKNIHAKAAFVLGTFHIVRDGIHYNEAALFNAGGDILNRYDKNKLIILGEYWPYAWHPSLYDFLKDDPDVKNSAFFRPSNSYTAGGVNLMYLGQRNAGVPFGTLICLEAHYPDMIRTYKNLGAAFIVNPTSNRWISSGADLYGHLVGNLYAIESVQSGLPIVVSSINGFAGVLFPNGERATQWDGATTRDIAY